ncbi:MAG: toll/interleukin-1 receptor domain-containing protein [Candidatus Thiodiazotropha endolucinida]
MSTFISHSFKDEAVYSAICLAFDAAGIERWDPKQMSIGESLADQLNVAIQSCEVCVFIATRRSIESPWCLAELGAFWGAGKKVMLFLSDPDLADSVLPPQFKDDLKANTAQELIEAVKQESKNFKLRAKLDKPYEFFVTSGNYGKEKDWLSLLEDTQNNFDVLGVAIGAWRKTNGFTEKVLQKAKDNCKIRFLLMHQDNDLLKGLLYSEKSYISVIHDIQENYAYYSDLASKNSNIEVRQVKKGIPHFFLTRTDQHSIIIQYQSSQTWGSGPTWRCHAGSDLYNVSIAEFEHLWTVGSNEA